MPSLTAKEVEIAKVLFKINAIKEFPITDEMIAIWAKLILELRSWVTPEHLNNVMNRFATGDLEWDKNLGIQNIFRGIQSTPRPNSENHA